MSGFAGIISLHSFPLYSRFSSAKWTGNRLFKELKPFHTEYGALDCHNRRLTSGYQGVYRTVKGFSV